MNITTINGVEIHLASQVEVAMSWVGQEEVVQQLQAAWTVTAPGDLPMNPRLIGKPGVGKTTLAYTVAQSMNRPVWLFQATMDTRPEDLLISPVIAEGQKIKYVASSLVTAVIQGGVCILDEGNRMSEKSWASLAPLLDHRRYVESIVAGVTIQAHPNFCFCTTMNEDSSTYEIPEYILSRIQPGIFIDFPSEDEEYSILKENVPFVEDALLRYVVEFLQKSHARNLMFTIRDGINVARYAFKLTTHKEMDLHDSFLKSIEMILGKDDTEDLV
ncbi:AAA domain-containing protein [bacterium]|jgi:MoxR-like ATPase|nr:AAA domain-containing protein [bacterium]